jgi:cyanate permease
MSWAQGLILWIVFGGLAAFIWGEVTRTQSKDRGDDWLAARKRRIEQRGQRVRMGVE